VQGGRPRRPAARSTRGLWRRSAQRGSGSDDPMGRSTPVLRRCGGVRTGQRATGGEKKNETAAEITCVGSWPNYGEDAARIGAIGLRVKPGLGAELWRGLAGVVARQGGVATTAWSFCTAELGGGTAWFGSGYAGRGRVRRREGSRGQINREAVILGAGRWQASPGDLGGTLHEESGSRQRIACSRLWLLLLEGRSVLGWLAGGATGLRRSIGQRDDPAGQNRFLGEDRGAGERSARAEGEG
jgi:hypothetical protein